MTPGSTDAEAWDWDEVRRTLVLACERNAGDSRNAVQVLAVDRAAHPWDVRISFVDRRDGRQHQERFDLLACVSAYDATTAEQLAGMVYSDLEESVLSAPSG